MLHQEDADGAADSYTEVGTQITKLMFIRWSLVIWERTGAVQYYKFYRVIVYNKCIDSWREDRACQILQYSVKATGPTNYTEKGLLGDNTYNSLQRGTESIRTW